MNTRASTIFLLICGTIVLLGVMLRITFLAEPIWIDELHTAWVANGSYPSILDRSTAGNQTPFYFALVFLFCQWTDLNEFSLRLPSLIFGTSSIFVAGLIVWRSTNHLFASALAAIIFAIDSWMMFWSVEARPYAMLQLAALLQFWVLLAEFNAADRLPNRINWKLVGLTVSLPMIHLSAIVLLACQFLCAAILLTSTTRRRVLTSMTIAALFTLLSTPTLFQVLGNRGDWVEFSSPWQLIEQLRPLLVGCVLIPILVSVFVKVQAKNEIQRHELRLVVCCSLGPVILAATIAGWKILPIATPRYLAPSIALLPLLAGLTVARLERCQLIVASLILLLCVMLNPFARGLSQMQPPQFRSENWKSAVQRLNENAKQDQIVFLFGNLYEDHRLSQDSPEAFRNYLKFPLNSLYTLNQSATVIAMPTLRRTDRWNGEHMETIRRHRQVQIIARVNRADFDLIIQELNNLANESELQLEITREQQKGNDLRLAFVKRVD